MKYQYKFNCTYNKQYFYLSFYVDYLNKITYICSAIITKNIFY